MKTDDVNGTRFLTLLLITAAVAVGAEAQGRQRSPADAQIVGHVSFGETTLADMALTTAGGRRYLYVQHSKDEDLSIVEVTNPSQPKLLATVFWPDGAQLGQLTFLGDYAIGYVMPPERWH